MRTVRLIHNRTGDCVRLRRGLILACCEIRSLGWVPTPNTSIAAMAVSFSYTLQLPEDYQRRVPDIVVQTLCHCMLIPDRYVQ